METEREHDSGIGTEVMLTYVRTSIFESPAQTLVNTVNVVGVMGKGIALEFKKRYPDMFKHYKQFCDTHQLEIGKLHLWRAADHWILNFPTKTTWKKPSKIEYVEKGLETFIKSYRQMGISSISFPPLGCGNGNLAWDDVRPIMESYLRALEIPVYIHDRQVREGFVPEHKEPDAERVPVSFDDFLHDIYEQIRSKNGQFETLRSRTPFVAKPEQDGGIAILSGGQSAQIHAEHMEWAWVTLQSGFLSADQFPGEDARRARSYLFAILAELPYVRVAELRKPESSDAASVHGLYINRSNRMASKNSAEAQGSQYCLSL
jgi:O-acetyl-ADP-ribose deacetylase (regulator of RNase III)